jgi:hypothetical protein
MIFNHLQVLVIFQQSKVLTHHFQIQPSQLECSLLQIIDKLSRNSPLMDKVVLNHQRSYQALSQTLSVDNYQMNHRVMRIAEED